MGLDGLEGFITDGMLHFAGIRRRSLRTDTHLHQNLRQHRVPLVDLFRDLPSGIRQNKGAVLLHDDVIAASQDSHGP